MPDLCTKDQEFELGPTMPDGGSPVTEVDDDDDTGIVEEGGEDYDDEWDKLTNPDREEEELGAKKEGEDDDDDEDDDKGGADDGKEILHTGDKTGAEAGDGKTNKEGDDKGKPESLEERFARLEKEHATLTHQFESERGRSSGLQRKLEEARRNMSGRGPSDQQIAKAMESPAEWKKFEEEYPEMSKAINGRLSALKDEIITSTRKEVNAVIRPLSVDADDRRREKELTKLTELHSDWETIVGSDDFATWINKQPSSVKQMIKSENAADAAFLVQAFKDATGTPPSQTDADKEKEEEARKAEELRKKREKQKQDGAGISTSTKTGRTGEETTDVDFDTAFAAHAKKKDKQLRQQGRL